MLMPKLNHGEFQLRSWPYGVGFDLGLGCLIYKANLPDRTLGTPIGIRLEEFVGGALVALRCEASSQPTAAKEMVARDVPFRLR